MTSREEFEYVVVGSGPAGAMAAQRLVELGKTVLMIDVADDDPEFRAKVPDLAFDEIRKTDPNQRDYFIGRANEGIPRGEVKVGAHLTPPRQFVRRRGDQLPTDVRNASVMQSLALGGLGAAWGAGVATYPDFELRAMGLSPEVIGPAYREVAARIGVSGEACALVAGLESSMSAPLSIDENATAVLERFGATRRDDSLELGRYPLAALSGPLGARQANPLHDMDFYSDARGSVFRPRYVVAELLKSPNFALRRGVLVSRIRASDGALELDCRHVDGNGGETIRARRVLLAAGAIGSARILMNSIDAGRSIGQPLLANPYRYWVMLNYPRLGRRSDRDRHSLAQLFGLYRPGQPDEVSLSFYSYRSLLLFKLVREFPMPARLGLLFARLLVDSLVVVGVHERATEARIVLVSPGDRGPAALRIDGPERKLESLGDLRSRLQRLGLLRLAEVEPGWGSSIHYAGTIPVGSARAAAIRAEPDFQVAGLPGVYLADSSAWNELPARGLTLTIMAHARSLAERVARSES